MIFKAGIEKLKWSDLDILITEPYHEDAQLDFKEKIPDKDDKQGWERLFVSICAFANTHGGILIFGIKESGGIAQEICPFLIDDFEKIRLQLIEKSRIYLNPTPTINFWLPIFKETTKVEGCLIIQIPKSFEGPHMLSNHSNLSPNKQCRFYKRVESQNFVMEHQEIGEQFMMREKWLELTKKHFHERKNLLLAREHPINLDEAPYAFFYLAPLGPRSGRIAFTQEFLDAFRLPSSQNLGFDRDRPSFEGHLFYNYIPNNNPVITTQLFNIFYNGSFEIIFGKHSLTIGENSESLYLKEGVIERTIVKLCVKFFEIYARFFPLPPPFAVYYSIMGVREKKLFAYRPWEESDQTRQAEMRGTNIHICSDELSSNIYLEQELTSEKMIGEMLKPLFDPIWRAIGKDQSLNYDSTGAWKANDSEAF